MFSSDLQNCVCSDSGFLFCLMSLFFVEFCFVRDELLIQIQEFIIHHHVDDEETKSVEMKSRVFRAHFCFCQYNLLTLFFELLFVCLQRLNCFREFGAEFESS
jgi:hypothetical protein